jgi:hypothetical protein
VLTLGAPGAESLWDEVLPVEVRELPEDLARLDGLLRDRQPLRAIERHWRREPRLRGVLRRRTAGPRSRWRRMCG